MTVRISRRAPGPGPGGMPKKGRERLLNDAGRRLLSRSCRPGVILHRLEQATHPALARPGRAGAALARPALIPPGLARPARARAAALAGAALARLAGRRRRPQR